MGNKSIAVVLLMLVLGCAPQSPPRYKSGDLVYHRLNGAEMIITEHRCMDLWNARYVDDLGTLRVATFREAEFVDERIDHE